MNIVPAFGNEPDPQATQFINQLNQQTNSLQRGALAQQLAMSEAQTADLNRRGDAYIATLNNADKLVSAAGVAPLLATLNSGVDPARGLQNPAALEYATQFGAEADQLRLMQDFASGFKDAGQGAAYFTDKVGRLPDLAAIGQRQWPGFTSVPRGGALSGRGGGSNARVADEVATFIDAKTGQQVGIVSTSRDPAWMSNLQFTQPEVWRKMQSGDLRVIMRPVFQDGSIRDYTYPTGNTPPQNFQEDDPTDLATSTVDDLSLQYEEDLRKRGL